MDYQGELKMKQRADDGEPSQVRQLWVPSGDGYVRDDVYENRSQLRPPGTENIRYDVYKNHRESFDKYYRQIQESEGFDIDIENFQLLPRRTLLNCMVPLVDIHNYRTTYENVVMLAEFAINYYNIEHEKAYQFVNLEKANSEVVAGSIFYITFQVKNLKAGDDTPLETFQAKVWYQPWNGKIDVQLCRPKPIKPQN